MVTTGFTYSMQIDPARNSKLFVKEIVEPAGLPGML